MDYNELREGNLVVYTGKLPKYNGLAGIITSFDNINGEDIYHLKVKDYKKEETEIVAYPGEIRYIELEAEHLEKLNFIKDARRNVFRLGSLVIIYPIVQYINQHREVHKGFVVITDENLKITATEEEIDKYTSSVGALSSLQNYFSDNNLGTIDIKLFY